MQLSPDEYRRYASEAQQWADRARTHDARTGFLDLALTWERAAQEAENEVRQSCRLTGERKVG